MKHAQIADQSVTSSCRIIYIWIRHSNVDLSCQDNVAVALYFLSRQTKASRTTSGSCSSFCTLWDTPGLTGNEK